MKINIIAAVAILSAVLVSCNTSKKISYFQDRDSISTVTVAEPVPIKVQAGDKIAIVVKCDDPEQTSLFNLYNVNQVMGSNSRVSVSGSNGVMGYTVAPDGTIDFPTLGKLTVAGMSRHEIADKVKNELAAQGQALNANVTVEFMDLGVTVMGEVRNPGRQPINRDQYTLLDALASAGDLTIDAKRSNIMVMRQEGNKMKNYQVDLRDGRQLLTSPVYYLQQNDMVYVEPSEKKARSSTINGNTVLSASFWISIASLIATLVGLTLRFN